MNLPLPGTCDGPARRRGREDPNAIALPGRGSGWARGCAQSSLPLHQLDRPAVGDPNTLDLGMTNMPTHPPATKMSPSSTRADVNREPAQIIDFPRGRAISEPRTTLVTHRGPPIRKTAGMRQDPHPHRHRPAELGRPAHYPRSQRALLTTTAPDENGPARRGLFFAVSVSLAGLDDSCLWSTDHYLLVVTLWRLEARGRSERRPDPLLRAYSHAFWRNHRTWKALFSGRAWSRLEWILLLAVGASGLCILALMTMLIVARYRMHRKRK